MKKLTNGEKNLQSLFTFILTRFFKILTFNSSESGTNSFQFSVNTFKIFDHLHFILVNFDFIKVGFQVFDPDPLGVPSGKNCPIQFFGDMTFNIGCGFSVSLKKLYTFEDKKMSELMDDQKKKIIRSTWVIVWKGSVQTYAGITLIQPGLAKRLYGFRDASRAWWQEIHSTHVRSGKKCQSLFLQKFRHVLVCNISLLLLSFLRQTDNCTGMGIHNNS